MNWKKSALLRLFVIGVSLSKSVSATTSGTCTADDPATCENTDDKNLSINDADKSGCQDEHPKCSEWATIGECEENPGYMLFNCRRSCMQCPDQAEELAKILEEKKKSIRVWTAYELEIAEDMGEEQLLENESFNVSADQSSARIIAARKHIEESGIGQELEAICKNKHEHCTTW